MMWRSLTMDFTQFIPIPNVSLRYPLKYKQGILEYQTVPFLSFPAENYPKTIMKEEKQHYLTIGRRVTISHLREYAQE